MFMQQKSDGWNDYLQIKLANFYESNDESIKIQSSYVRGNPLKIHDFFFVKCVKQAL